ncbi:MAG: hypothetical protein H0U71_08305 [Gammaproteobacteria bacterium]|nr:hypothetical protein [Gammaproteobacteria bacterium]
MLPKMSPKIQEGVAEIRNIIEGTNQALPNHGGHETSMLTDAGRRRFVAGTYKRLTTHYAKAFQAAGGTEGVFSDLKTYIDLKIKEIQAKINHLWSIQSNNNNSNSSRDLQLEEKVLNSYINARSTLEEDTKPFYEGGAPRAIYSVNLVEMTAYYWLASSDHHNVKKEDLAASKAAFVYLLEENKLAHIDDNHHDPSSCSAGIFGRYAQNGAPHNPVAETFPLTEQMYYQMTSSIVEEVSKLGQEIQAGFFSYLNNQLMGLNEDTTQKDSEHFEQGITLISANSYQKTETIFSKIIHAVSIRGKEFLFQRMHELYRDLINNLRDGSEDGAFVEKILFTTIRSRKIYVIKNQLESHTETIKQSLVETMQILSKVDGLNYANTSAQQRVQVALYPAKLFSDTSPLELDEFDNAQQTIIEAKAIIDKNKELLPELVNGVQKSLEDMKPEVGGNFHKNLVLSTQVVGIMKSDENTNYAKLAKLTGKSKELEVVLNWYFQKMVIAIVKLANRQSKHGPHSAQYLSKMVRLIFELNPEVINEIFQSIVELLSKLPTYSRGLISSTLKLSMGEHTPKDGVEMIDFTKVQRGKGINLQSFLKTTKELTNVDPAKLDNLSTWMSTVMLFTNNSCDHNQSIDQITMLALASVFGRNFEELQNISTETVEQFGWLCSLYLAQESQNIPEYSDIAGRISSITRNEDWPTIRKNRLEKNADLRELTYFKHLTALGQHLIDLKLSLEENSDLFIEGKLKIINFKTAQQELGRSKQAYILHLSIANPREVYITDYKGELFYNCLIADMTLFRKVLCQDDVSGKSLRVRYESSVKMKVPAPASSHKIHRNPNNNNNNNNNSFFQPTSAISTQSQQFPNLHGNKNLIHADIKKLKELLALVSSAQNWPLDLSHVSINHEQEKAESSNRDILYIAHVRMEAYFHKAKALSPLQLYFNVLAERREWRSSYFEWNENFHNELARLHSSLISGAEPDIITPNEPANLDLPSPRNN